MFTLLQTNTFQGVLVTDFERSYAIYTYFCGDLGFSGNVTIGFATGDGMFADHESTLSGNAQSIACLNIPDSPWVNIVYGISSSGKASNSQLELLPNCKISLLFYSY